MAAAYKELTREVKHLQSSLHSQLNRLDKVTELIDKSGAPKSSF